MPLHIGFVDENGQEVRYPPSDKFHLTKQQFTKLMIDFRRFATSFSAWVSEEETILHPRLIWYDAKNEVFVLYPDAVRFDYEIDQIITVPEEQMLRYLDKEKQKQNENITE